MRLDIEITGLLAGQPVRIEIVAVNSLGQGPGVTATFRTLTSVPAIPQAQRIMSLSGPLGSQQRAAATQMGTLSCVVNVGHQGNGVLTRLEGLSQDTVCGYSSDEPIASVIA
jgi:hypothetical protein